MLEFAKDPKFWEKVRTSDDYKRLRDDLKEEYDAEDKDRITERVINLVEAGQL